LYYVLILKGLAPKSVYFLLLSRTPSLAWLTPPRARLARGEDHGSVLRQPLRVLGLADPTDAREAVRVA